MTKSVTPCLDCGEPTEFPEGRCLDCYRAWLETPAGSQDKERVRKQILVMEMWVGKTGPGADVAASISALAQDIPTGDADGFSTVAKHVIHVLNLVGQGIGLPDTEIAPLLRAAANHSSSLSRAVALAEAVPGGNAPADPVEAVDMIADQLRSAAAQVADFCDDLGLGEEAVAEGLRAAAQGILVDVAGRYPER